ncbi:MAG TPA: single-stranded DNA-binding protein [Smithellaceae bacterium]|jgi:single-strand DNA-binding protein|nr:single-stranded DNA-binding protein [Smithellaceae bacterium]HOU57435.1 single-stranded DNA-binding protein [Smithellaceae bacterium]HPL32661.1 single-stranded DNA-binding protein [Smithellaceae bacterium]HPY08061.1 single-stranded DNA-binding protein [Smithellaceae bacterium]HQH01021.1 single-stranded DNA-binding protein [Smithellaceae bacterium]
MYDAANSFQGGGIMVNKAILIGRLGKDPEVKYLPDGTMVTTFRIATDEQWKDKNGEKVQRTEWHQIVTYRKLAEICGNYLVKGKLVFIEGRIQTRNWEDKEGVKRYTTEIIANDMKMLDSKGQARPGDAMPDASSAPNSETPMDDVPF